MIQRFGSAAARTLACGSLLLGAAVVAACQPRPAAAPVSGAAGVSPVVGGGVDSAVLRAVLALDSTLLAAEERRDTAAMHEAYAPDYYAVAPDGEMLSVRARLFRVARGIRAMDSAQTLTAPWARQVGPTAVIVTRSTRLWGQSHGEAVTGMALRVTRLYVRRADTWRLLFQQGTPLADEHIAGTGPGAPPH
jgi:ketosteroid isomerase-like protein